MVESATRAQPAVSGLESLPGDPPTQGTVDIHLLPPASRHIFHGDAAARAAANPVWGAALPEDACRAVVSGERAALWLGPDEYLLLGPADEPHGAGIAALEHALSGIPHALADVSHRQVALQLSGSHAAAVLSGGCPLDLDIAAFPVGMCTRTVFVKADIVLWRTGPEVFHIEVWRSFTSYLVELLREIRPRIPAIG